MTTLSHRNSQDTFKNHGDISQKISLENLTLKSMDSIDMVLAAVGWDNIYVERQKNMIEMLLSHEEGDVIGAVLDNRLVGYIQAQHFRWNHITHIYGLIVSPDYQRNGIGSRLMEHVQKTSQQRKNRGVYVDTPTSNHTARSFYKAIGYTESFVMPEFYAPHLDGVMYVLWHSPHPSS